jgi:L-rhamnonate dehydratase
MAARDEITDVRAYLVEAAGAGGDYHARDKGHRPIDTPIANPMAGYPEYNATRVQSIRLGRAPWRGWW